MRLHACLVDSSVIAARLATVPERYKRGGRWHRMARLLGIAAKRHLRYDAKTGISTLSPKAA
jgi:hypothetical protein